MFPSTLAAIIVVAGYSLVEFQEAKWLYRAKRDEFWVWTASFVLTLLLGVMYGLAASITGSVIGLMWKTKRSPVSILGELDNGSLVDREEHPEAMHLLDVMVLRVEKSLYFANCEQVLSVVDEELIRLDQRDRTIKGVVIDAFSMNDLDATTLQVLSDRQEKLAFCKMGFAIANAKGKVSDISASTNLLKRLAGQSARIPVSEARALVGYVHDHAVATAAPSASTCSSFDRAW